MELSTVWFLLIAVLWTGYLVLEGFDFGVGMLLGVLGRSDTQRRVLINSIGPVWDGNEVWLLTAGGATFAAFPEWYATMFSGFYLPLLLILLALIVRVVAFEWRGKIDDDRWRRRADRALIVGSWVPAVLWGVAFGNLVRGVHLGPDHQYVGTFIDLLNPFALLGGATTALIFLSHGAVFLALKTGGEVREKAATLAARSAVAALALLALVLATRRRRAGWAFIASAVAIVAAVVLIFGSMYPDVMPGLDPANSLTVQNASSSDYTLTIMTWVAALLTPLVLAYQGWTYWVFRKRISAEQIPAHTGLTFPG